MTLEEFVLAFAGEFDETPIEKFQPETDYKSLDEWGSLAALSIIALTMVSFGKKLTGEELQHCSTIKDLYGFIQSK